MIPSQHPSNNVVSQRATNKKVLNQFYLFVGAKAKATINQSRENVARMVGGKAEDIIFTSGGTEVGGTFLSFSCFV